VIERPILNVRAFTVRLLLPASLIRKTSPLPNAIKIINMIEMMTNLVNIWYTLDSFKDGIDFNMLMRRFGQYYFKLSWTSMSLMVLGVSVFLGLGCWQCHRADEKRMMLAQYENERHQPPRVWQVGAVNPTQYQHLKVAGRYEQRFFLLDNQYHQHEWGYHVLSPFQVNEHTVLLVDRGWVKGEPLREHFPKVISPKDNQMISGEVYYARNNRWVNEVEPQKIDSGGWVIAQFEPQKIEKILHQHVEPFMIRLSNKEPHGWARNWQIVAMPPERHHAYAFQWFSLAAMVVVVFLVTSLKRDNEHI
jgi:surfeit locus 1 family protein